MSGLTHLFLPVALGPRSDTGVQNFLPGQVLAMEEGLSRASEPPAHGYKPSQYQLTER